MRRRVSEEMVRIVWGFLQLSPRFPYWEGGVAGLARAAYLSRREVHCCLEVLQARGLIVFKNERRGRGARALIRVRISRDGRTKVDRRLVGPSPAPPPIRGGGCGSKDDQRLSPNTHPQAFGWWARAMKSFRLDLRHPLLTRLVGRWIFYEGLPREAARAIWESLMRSRRWLFSLCFRSAKEAWRFFVWLLRWIVQRWLQTGRIFSAQEVYAYAHSLSLRPERWERLLGEGPLPWCRRKRRKRRKAFCDSLSNVTNTVVTKSF